MQSFKTFIAEASEVKLHHPETGTTAKIVHEKDGGLLFTALHTPSEHRGKGGAEHVVNQAKAYADKHKKKMRLNAIADEDDGDPKRLQKFYKKHGFESQEGKPSFMMVRHPK